MALVLVPVVICSSAPVHLAVGVEHPVGAALCADVNHLIGKGWHDLPWWQQCVLRLVAGKQNALALLFAQCVGNQTGNTSGPIQSFTLVVPVGAASQSPAVP